MSRLIHSLTQNRNFLGPALIIFISANIANVANLAFNMIFARLMSPPEFADLTLLVSIMLGLLSIFSALQFGVSEISAKLNPAEGRNFSALLSKRSLLWSIPLCSGLVIGAEWIADMLNFGNISALICLFLAIPLFLPMIIFRGLAQGQLNLPKMVGSFQVEWIVRLFGCWLLWMAGFGMTGIALALVLSVFAGLLFTIDRSDLQALKQPAQTDLTVLKTTMPYGLIFLAQVLALDGDIFIAKALLSDTAAGAAAGLLLIQRIFFFAFLSFATVLQPFVIGQAVSENETFKALVKLLLIMIILSGMALGIIAIKPELFIHLLLGVNYVDFAPMVITAGAIGVAIVGAQLFVVAMLARGEKLAPFILIGLTLIYYLSVGFMMYQNPLLHYGSLLQVKLVVFSAGLAVIGLSLLRKVR